LDLPGGVRRKEEKGKGMVIRPASEVRSATCSRRRRRKGKGREGREGVLRSPARSKGQELDLMFPAKQQVFVSKLIRTSTTSG